MSNRFQGRPSRFDLIDDLIDSSLSKQPRRVLSNRTYSNYSSLPSALNKNDHSSSNKLRDRFHLTYHRSNSSSIMSNNDHRQKELDLIIKHLHDGKSISTINDDYSETKTSTNTKTEKDNSNNLESFTLGGDITSLQRELQERELDIIHLRKDIHELHSENKQLKSKAPIITTAHTSNNQEIEAIRQEKEILQNELRTCQELVAKLQHQSLVDNRTKHLDEAVLEQKEILEKKLKSFEIQIRTLMHENEKYKHHSIQIESFIEQLKDENEDLRQKLNEEKKRNEILFYQEFNALRNDLKSLKQRNNELFDENLRLQHQRSKLDAKHGKNRNESPNISETSDSTNYLTTVNLDNYHHHHHHHRPLTASRHSVTMNENSSVRLNRQNSHLGHEDGNQSKSNEQQQFNSRTMKTKHGVAWINGNFPSNGDVIDDDDDDGIDDSKPTFSQSNHSIHRNGILNESPSEIQRSFIYDHRRQIQRNLESVSPRRPYAPESIKDIHLNDIIKFSRPGGKISKGVVKYIGTLPDKTEQYLGLELENEESKHDGVYQDKRLFHCKPNKGVFVAFNKVIMAWSER